MSNIKPNRMNPLKNISLMEKSFILFWNNLNNLVEGLKIYQKL